MLLMKKYKKCEFKLGRDMQTENLNVPLTKREQTIKEIKLNKHNYILLAPFFIFILYI